MTILGAIASYTLFAAVSCAGIFYFGAMLIDSVQDWMLR